MWHRSGHGHGHGHGHVRSRSRYIARPKSEPLGPLTAVSLPVAACDRHRGHLSYTARPAARPAHFQISDRDPNPRASWTEPSPRVSFQTGIRVGIHPSHSRFRPADVRSASRSLLSSEVGIASHLSFQTGTAAIMSSACGGGSFSLIAALSSSGVSDRQWSGIRADRRRATWHLSFQNRLRFRSNCHCLPVTVASGWPVLARARSESSALPATVRASEQRWKEKCPSSDSIAGPLK